jgi:inner membrane protein
MFNTTHTFVGILVAQTGAGKWAKYGTLTAVIASNLPDIDSVAGLWGTATYLEHHRGFTHTLIGTPILALLLSLVMTAFSENFGKTYAIALIAMATHPLLDFLNPYGVRPFLPLNSTWYYGDLVFIFDPYLDSILLIGILVAWRSRLRQVAAWTCMATALAYIGVRIQLHAQAQAKLEVLVSDFPAVEQLEVLPQMMSPLRWDGIVKWDGRIAKYNVGASDPDRFIPTTPTPPNFVAYRRSASEIADAAATSRSAAALLCFARFPMVRIEQAAGGYRVTFIDFRFYRETMNRALAAELMLDESRRVIKESLSFVQPID